MNRTNRTRISMAAIAAMMLLTVSAWAGTRPRNVIVMIGDGMGVAQLSLARLSRIESGKGLSMDSMTHGGLVRTYSANSAITDSAAAATALATGHKTNNGMISTLPDGKAVRTVLELMQARRKSVGLVTTTTITHATPAGFGSHVSSRGDEADIAPQYLEKKIDVLLGGGKASFVPKSVNGSVRKDDRDLLREAQAAGYRVMLTRDELLAGTDGKMLGLFQMGGLTTESPEPTLAEMTSCALDALSKDKDGFFLMVEGGQIDWACHANDTRAAVKQTLDFSDAVGRVLAFARKQGETLVIVTADHETGGLTICYPAEGSGLPFAAKWATTGHTGSDVPIFAEGPGADSFGGLLNNIDIPRRVAAVCGAGELTPAVQAAH